MVRTKTTRVLGEDRHQRGPKALPPSPLVSRRRSRDGAAPPPTRWCGSIDQRDRRWPVFQRPTSHQRTTSCHAPASSPAPLAPFSNSLPGPCSRRQINYLSGLVSPTADSVIFLRRCCFTRKKSYFRITECSSAASVGDFPYCRSMRRDCHAHVW